MVIMIYQTVLINDVSNDNNDVSNDNNDVSNGNNDVSNGNNDLPNGIPKAALVYDTTLEVVNPPHPPMCISQSI